MAVSDSRRNSLGRISSRFHKSIATYEQTALVQKEFGDHLISLLTNHAKISYGRVLEVGCCTGAMTEQMCNKFPIGCLYLNDLVPEFCDFAVQRVSSKVESVISLPGDIESVDLHENLDLIISSSTFQWLSDLGSCCQRLARSLSSGGYLVFSSFGPGTMEQLRELTGIGLMYLSKEQIVERVSRHMNIEYIETRRKTLHFQHPRDVLRHIQQTGVSGVKEYRWTTSTLKRFEQQYIERFMTTRGLPLDYISTFVVAKKKEI